MNRTRSPSATSNYSNSNNNNNNIQNQPPSYSHTQSPSHAQQHPPPKILSCTSCRRRKIRCNKSSPCLPCQASRTECIFPTRVRNPRPKQAGPKSRDSELLKRISHLESLVSRIDASKLTEHEDSPGALDETKSNESPRPSSAARANHTYELVEPFEHTGPIFGKLDHQYASFIKRQETDSIYAKDSFWTRLTEEVDGLRQLIENSSDGEDEPGDSVGSSPVAKYSSPSQFIFDTKNAASVDIATLYPSFEHRRLLNQIYFSNVHPMVKVTHREISGIFLPESSELIDSSTGRFKFNSLEAFTFSMHLAAVTSMSPEDCLKHFNEERDILVARYKTATEIALQESDFFNSVEIVTLQALILYITAMRSHDRSRFTWTFLGLAIRIAQALGIHRDGNGSKLSVFDTEMRRRLWWTLVVLDTRASEDRGSETMISAGSFSTRLPTNVNDEDFSVTTKLPLVDKKCPTEMTFPLIIMITSHTFMKLNFVSPDREDRGLTCEEKEQLVKECTEKIEASFLNGADPLKVESWWTSMVGRLLSMKLWLVTQYPLQSKKSSRVLPRGQSLRTAIVYLELMDQIWQHQLSSGYFWFFQTYVPWHAIAIALAELCVEISGPLTDHAWEVVEKNFTKWSEFVADTKDGMIWRPVKNLLKRARAARAQQKNPQDPYEAQFSSVHLQPPEQILPGTDLGFSALSMGNGMGNSFDLLPQMGFQADAMAQPMYPSFGFDLSTPMDMPMDSIPTESNVYSDVHWNEFLSDVGAAANDNAPHPDMMWTMQDYFTGS